MANYTTSPENLNEKPKWTKSGVFWNFINLKLWFQLIVWIECNPIPTSPAIKIQHGPMCKDYMPHFCTNNLKPSGRLIVLRMREALMIQSNEEYDYWANGTNNCKLQSDIMSSKKFLNELLYRQSYQQYHGNIHVGGVCSKRNDLVTPLV